MQFALAPFCCFGVPCLFNFNNNIPHITCSMKHFTPSGGDCVRLGDTLWCAPQTPLYIQNVFQRFLFSFVIVFFFLRSERHCFPLLLPLFSFLLLFSFSFGSFFAENGRRSPLYAFFCPRGRQCIPFRPSENDSGVLAQLRSYHATLPCFPASTIVRSIGVFPCICPCVCGRPR